MLERLTGGERVTKALAAAIAGATTTGHLDRMIDLVGAIVQHDVVTVTRYSVTDRPTFVVHRHYSDAMVRRYLDTYYAYDPFYSYWRSEQQPGVVPLRRLADAEMKRGRYIAEFLKQSVICDEIGVLLADGAGCCLGIFLDREHGPFTRTEIARLQGVFPVLEALHALQVEYRAEIASAGVATARGVEPPAGHPTLPAALWSDLSARERAVAALILAGHPNAGIARRLSIAVGTVKNHRHSIYAKLDITTEREMFLQFFAFGGGAGTTAG